MRVHRSIAVTLLPLAMLVAGAQPSAPGLDEPLTAEDGQRLATKLDQIYDHDAVGSVELQTVTLPEREVNAYLRFQAKPQLPRGVREPHIAIEGEGRLSARAIVDLDVVSGSRPRGWLDPLRYLHGDVLVAASGILRTADGIGELEIESVTVGGLSVPMAVLNELVRYYSRSETHPRGFDLAEPFELPYSIRNVLIGVGEAVVVQ